MPYTLLYIVTPYVEGLSYGVWSYSYQNILKSVATKALPARTYASDLFCRLLFGLAGLKTQYYHSERDLISPKFKPSKRIVNGATDFDVAIRKGIIPGACL